MFKLNAIRPWVFCLAVLLICTAAFAQVQTGSIEGVVTDPTSAAIPGATVTITDTDTGITREVPTDSQGRFAASSLQIGNYKVQASMQGFATQAQQGLALAVGQVLPVNFTLQVGTVAQEITVSSTAAPQVNTTTSEIGSLVGQSQLQELPLNGRNYEQLVALAPGVAPLQAPTSGANFGRAQRYSIAGARVDAGMILLDGVNIRGFWGNEAGLEITGTSLGVESIAEFQVITNSANAEYSNVSVLSEVTRSGSNNFHGSAYGFFRNSAMDARGFFDPLSGPPPFHRNQFGGSVGGPIKKDKTFFFANYEGIRASLALNDTEVVPDHQAHLGIINGTNVGVNSAVAPYLALYPDYGQPGQPALPPGYTDNPVTGTASFITSGAQPQTENYIAVKLDHQINAKNNLSGRVVSDRGDQTDPWFGASSSVGSPGDIMFPGLEHDPEMNLYTTLQERYVASANLINVATFAFVRTNQEQEVNLKAVPAPLLAFNGLGQPGALSIGNVASIPAPSYEPLQQIQNTYTEQDQVDWIHGAHSFTFGGGVARIQCACIQNSGGGGAWTFPNLTMFLTNNKPSLYTGQFPASGLTAYQAGVRYGRQTNFSIFAQDDWRVTRRVTLNLGIRDDYITNPTEAANNFYDILHLDPLTCSVNPACDGGTPEPGVSTGFTHVPHMFAKNPSTRNIDPRIGLAWDIFGSGKTSFRAAYGIYHNLIFPHYYVVGSGFIYPNGTTQLVSFSGPNGGDTFPTVPPTAIIPQSRTKPNYYICCTPYMQEWNATIEQQLPGHLKMALSYVGSNGIHLNEQQQYNTILPVPGTQFRPFSPAAAAKLPECIVGNGLYNAATCSAAQAGFGVGGAGYLPNVDFTSVQWFNTAETSNYHSGVLTVSRSFSSGVQFSSSFTYARCLDYGSVTTGGPELGNDSTLYLYPAVPKKYNYGPCAFNIGKNWTSNALIPLPFHGNRLKEGWQFGVIATVHTGNPLTANLNGATDQSNVLYYTNAQERASVNPNFTGQFYNLQKNALATPGVTTVPYFNPAAFQIGTLGQLGNAPRESISGPNLFNMDFSVMKRTTIPKLSESSGLELRGDFFNVLNHTNFGLPNNTIFNGTAGAVTANAAAGRISTIIGTARQLQFSARFVF